MYNPNTLITAIYFWDSSTNTFHLPCRMVTHILFYISSITGLQSTGETFDPTLKHQIKPNFTFDHPSFSNSIKYYHNKTKEVSDYEHIAFLTLWQYHFIFCSSSLHVAKKFIPLATQNHEKKDVCLSKLILRFLYESLGIASHDLKARMMHEENFLVSGPTWLLQL